MKNMLIRASLTLLLVGLSVGGPLSRKETAKPRADDVNYRLPRHIKPLHYTLRLTPDIDNAIFDGSVIIRFNVIEPSINITLHNRQLVILQEDIVVRDSNSEIIQVTSIENGDIAEQEFFIIILANELVQGEGYTLEISKFTGTLNNQNQGFYLAQYNDENGIVKKFATTQFEPTAARRAFPCFDEPALKAIFKIFLTLPDSTFSSIANTPKIIPGTETNVDEFEETVEMSTYLVAFIVSQMELSANGNHRVLARPQAIAEKTEQYALNTGIQILNEIANFVGVDYTLSKMDQAAIPDAYFSAGAMENWGLVTYRETYLLKSDKSTTTSRHQSIATIIAHEFGHQWFGNLVSPDWWQYIWLNEGFATYFEHMAASLVETEWRIMDQFVVKNTQYVFGPDSLDTTRAMNHEAGSPTEVSALFDRIAYEKSGSVIRMMEAFLTTEVFRNGLKYYLENMGRKSATPADLYANLQTAVTENNALTLPDTLSVIMESWDSHKGYPVIDVTRNYATTGQEELTLNQGRFLLKTATSDDTNVWIIPLNFATKNSPNFDITSADRWLTMKEESITLTGLRSEDWLIINKQQTGYYRVNYDIINWSFLIDALANDFTQIHLLNRAQLIDDSFNLARSGRLSYGIPFQLSSYLSKELDYIPFYSFFTAATFLHTILPGSPAHANFKLHVLAALDGVHKHLGFNEKEDDTHLDKLNRVNVYNWLCNLGDAECRSTALTQFRNWKNDVLMVPLDLQAPVYCAAMRTANQEDWDFLYSKYGEVVNTDDVALRARILSALGCSENTEILENFLNTATAEDSLIRPEEAFAAIYNSGSIGVTVAFEYVSNNFERLNSLTQLNMATILNGIGAKLTTQEQLAKLIALSETHSEQNALFTTAIANAEENMNWNEVHLLEITGWLSRYGSGGNILNAFSTGFVVILSYFLHKLVS